MNFLRHCARAMRRESGGTKMKARLGIASRYEAITEVKRAAITQGNLKEIFDSTFGALKKVIPCDRVGLSLYTPDKDALQLTATDGCGVESFYRVGLTLDCKETHHGWVFRNKRPILRRDLRRDLQFPIEEYNVAEGIRSYCAVPLVVRDKSLGVMIVLSSDKNRYSRGHAEFLQEMSDQLVLAITSMSPFCLRHAYSKMICPRCIASEGGQITASRHKLRLSEWGKKGGRGRKKPAGGLAGNVFG